MLIKKINLYDYTFIQELNSQSISNTNYYLEILNKSNFNIQYYIFNQETYLF